MTKLKKTDPNDYLSSLFSKRRYIYFGDELKQKLVDNLGKSPDNARKIVGRFVAKGFVTTSKPFSFGKNTFAYYPIDHKLTFDELIGLTRNRRPPLFRLLSAIKACKGILSYYEALKVCSTPLVASKSKTLSLDQIIKQLLSFNAFTIQSDQNNNKFLIANFVDSTSINTLMANHLSLMMTDTAFLYDVLMALSRFNLIDNRYVRYRDRRAPTKGQKHLNYVWDAFSYTKTSGINTVYGSNTITLNKQALVVLDMTVSRTYESFDYDGFNERIQVLLNNTKTGRKIIPVIVYKDISTEALRRARAFGMLTCNMASFFGSGINEVIENLIAIKMSENGVSTGEIDSVGAISETMDIIDRTGNLYNLSNLTGDFFQSLMYQFFHHLYPNSIIEQGKKLPALDNTFGRKKKYEYDFVIQTSNTNEIIAIELKGTLFNYTVPLGDNETKNSLKWFFERTLPSFSKNFPNSSDSLKRVKASFITSGRFDKEGKSYLSELNKGTLKPQKINISYNGKQLLKLIDQESLYTLKNVLENYFVKEN